MSDLLQDLDSLQDAARNEIAQTCTLVDLEHIRVRLFGKKGEVTAKLKSLGALDPETRRNAGARILAPGTIALIGIGIGSVVDTFWAVVRYDFRAPTMTNAMPPECFVTVSRGSSRS